MPEKHFYFSIGATVGSAVCVALAKKRHEWRKTSRFLQWLYRKEPQWFLYFPLIILAIGIWGLIPDIIHLMGWLPKEQTRGALFDVFFFHSTLEHIENTMPVLDYYLNIIGEFLLLAIALAVMFYYVIQIKKAVANHQQSRRASK